jgi:hypothetical protein
LSNGISFTNVTTYYLPNRPNQPTFTPLQKEASLMRRTKDGSC